MASKMGVHEFGDIATLHARFREQTLTPLQVLEVCLASIKSRNAQYNAIVTLLEKEAFAAAEESRSRYARGVPRGPLDGVPVTVKDAFSVEGCRFTSGSRVYGERVGTSDADIVRCLREQGAVLIGKTNLAELTFGLTSDNPLFGPTRNPLDLNLDAGGSSGGDAAAVAAGFCKLGIGSDLGGSLRLPAAWVGAAAIKPTPGHLPTRGHFPDAWKGIAAAGLIGRSMGDVALGFDSLRGYQRSDCTTLPLGEPRRSGRMKFAVLKELGGIPLDPKIAAAIDATTRSLVALGYEAVQVDLSFLACPLDFFFCLGAGHGGSPGALAAVFQRLDLAGPTLQMFIQAATANPVAAHEFAAAESRRYDLMERLQRTFESVDVLVTASSPVLAQTSGTTLFDIAGRQVHIFEAQIYTWIFSLLCVPALTLPPSASEDVLGGVQLVGPRFADRQLLELAIALESRVPA